MIATVSRIETDASIVLVLTGLAALVIVAYAVFAWIVDRATGGRAVRRRLHEISQMPRVERYPGCITCEAAEAVSYAALCRHQAEFHAGGIRWSSAAAVR